MGKGVVPDSHSLCVASARTYALQNADVILLLGARLNWILHFGKPPRFNATVKFVQIDINAEELHNSQQASVAIQADMHATVNALSVCLTEKKWQCVTKDWLNRLDEKCLLNKKYIEVSHIRTNIVNREQMYSFLHMVFDDFMQLCGNNKCGQIVNHRIRKKKLFCLLEPYLAYFTCFKVYCMIDCNKSYLFIS